MSHSVSNDFVDFHDLLKRHSKDIEDGLFTIPTKTNYKEFDCKLDQHITMKTTSRCRTNLTLPIKESLQTTKHFLTHNQNLLNEPANISIIDTHRSNGEAKEQSFQDTKKVKDTNIINLSIGPNDKPVTETLSGNSSPNSNFSCTPTESVSSCTSESTLGNDLNEVSDVLPTSPEPHLPNILADSYDTDNECQMNSAEVDAAEKFFLEQFNIDGEIDKMILSSCTPQIHSMNCSKKRSALSNISGNYKKQKIIQEPNFNDSNLRKCFSKLKSNYLSLCQTHNHLLEDYNKTKHQNRELRRALDDLITEKEILENEKDCYLLEREDMKAAMESLLHEVTTIRAKSKMKGNGIC